MAAEKNEVIAMGIIRLTSMTCQGCTTDPENPLQLEVFFENVQFSPQSQTITLTCPGTTSFDPQLEVGLGEGRIHIHQNGQPSHFGDTFFTYLSAGPGSSNFFPFFPQSDSQPECELRIDYDVANDPITLTIAFVQAIAFAIFAYARSLFWLLIAPWKYLSFRRLDRSKLNSKQD